MVLVPDTHQASVYKTTIAPHLTTGKMLMFAHGFNIRFGWIMPPADVDVTMVAPKAPGHRVREVFMSKAAARRHCWPFIRTPPATRAPRRCPTRKGIGVHPRRRHRDDVRRRDRNRSVR